MRYFRMLETIAFLWLGMIPGFIALAIWEREPWWSCGSGASALGLIITCAAMYDVRHDKS